MIETKRDNPIRVCFAVVKAYPLFNPAAEGIFGGAEVDSYFLATELAKDDRFRVSFIVADYGQPPVEQRENVTLIKASDFDRNRPVAVLKLWQALKKADADIYVRKMSSLVSAEVALFCKLKGRKFVYRSAHKDECDGTYIRKHSLRGRVYIRTLRSAAAVVVQRVTDTDELLSTTGVTSTAIANGHRLGPVNTCGRDSVLWVGRNIGFKRAELFVKLAELLPEYRFTMICQKPKGDTRYDELVRTAKGAGNMTFIPKVPFGQIDDFFERAKVLVNTSDSEGFPNTFIQACRAATPILSLNVNPDGFLDRYNCGTCCDGDWDKFVESLKSMLADHRYIEMGRAARKYVEDNHDVAKIIEQYKQLFMGIAAADTSGLKRQ